MQSALLRAPLNGSQDASRLSAWHCGRGWRLGAVLAVVLVCTINLGGMMGRTGSISWIKSQAVSISQVCGFLWGQSMDGHEGLVIAPCGEQHS